jgi:hypothetical protein
MAKAEITVNKWREYKGRKDVKNNSWFRCSNRLLEDPDFYDFDAEELMVWIYILSICSQKNSGTFCLFFAHANKVCRLSEKAVRSALCKLSDLGIISTDVTHTLRTRYADVTDTCATNITNITNITEQTNKHPKCEFDFKKSFEKYPIQVRGPDAEKRFRNQIVSEKDQDDLQRALLNYKTMLSIETWRKPKQTFAAFLGTKSSGFFWRDFIDWTPPEITTQSADDYVNQLLKQGGV